MKKNNYWLMTFSFLLFLLCYVIIGSAQQKGSTQFMPLTKPSQSRIKKETRIYAPYVDFSLKPHWDGKKKALVPGSLSTLSKQSGVHAFRLGFIVQQRYSWVCDPTWGGYKEYKVSKGWGVDDINQFRHQGGDVTIAFGGEAGTYLSHSAKSVSQLTHAYQKVVDTYQVYSLDFDIEEAHLNDRIAINRQMAALKELQDHYRSLNKTLRISFTLPAMPTGLEAACIRILENAIKHHVNITQVNIMVMDYGTIGFDPAKMGTYAVNAAKKAHAQLAKLYSHRSQKALWSMMGMTPMIGVNDSKPEQFTIGDAKMLERFAKKQGVAFLSNWSINRDHPCASSIANEFCSGTYHGYKIQTSSYQFAKIFNQI